MIVLIGILYFVYSKGIIFTNTIFFSGSSVLYSVYLNILILYDVINNKEFNYEHFIISKSIFYFFTLLDTILIHISSNTNIEELRKLCDQLSQSAKQKILGLDEIFWNSTKKASHISSILPYINGFLDEFNKKLIDHQNERKESIFNIFKTKFSGKIYDVFFHIMKKLNKIKILKKILWKIFKFDMNQIEKYYETPDAGKIFEDYIDNKFSFEDYFGKRKNDPREYHEIANSIEEEVKTTCNNFKWSYEDINLYHEKLSKQDSNSSFESQSAYIKAENFFFLK